MRTLLWVLVALVLVRSAPASAQTTTGSLAGWIFDAGHQPVIGANVSVTSPELQGVRGAATDDGGCFHIPALPAGTYSANIAHISYRQTTVNHIRILLGQTTTIGELQLTQRTIEAQEVVVSAEQRIIDTRSTTNGMNLSNGRFTTLPIERSFIRVPELLPNANQSYKKDGTNFAGATGVENKYFIDGAEVTEPHVGLADFDLPYNFVREVEVRSGGYEAEYPGSLGGIVNAVTYSGGNEVHGKVFGFLTNNNFRGAPQIVSGEPPQGNFSDYDVGVGIGGSLADCYK